MKNSNFSSYLSNAQSEGFEVEGSLCFFLRDNMAKPTS